jgi:hypothetical protein
VQGTARQEPKNGGRRFLDRPVVLGTKEGKREREGKDERIEFGNGRKEGETYETQVNIRLFD